ncbi:uncharacterized protein LOC142575934 isoform X6 [Dermacentor variabilis]|uniref:uncharacterized protein LOC142575934 isoform X6 n=1 Tax=Dermacentor variabilis TaxID=34621 RepID=UPI003F5B9FC4
MDSFAGKSATMLPFRDRPMHRGVLQQKQDKADQRALRRNLMVQNTCLIYCTILPGIVVSRLDVVQYNHGNNTKTAFCVVHMQPIGQRNDHRRHRRSIQQSERKYY